MTTHATSKLPIAGLLGLIALLIAMSVAGCLGVQERTRIKPDGSSVPSHHTKNGFHNPWSTQRHGSLLGFMKARFASGSWASYDPDVYEVPVAQPALLATQNSELLGKSITDPVAVTWIGHATVLVEYGGVTVLTDPMFSNYASPLSFAGPKRYTQPALGIVELPPIDVVVISHNHYDHLDVASIRRLGNSPRYFVPLGVKAWLEDKGIDADRVTELDWWGSSQISVADRSLRLTATPAQHFSGRGLFDRDQTLWASWAIAWSDFTLWFGGDTGYHAPVFQEIGQRIANIDLGIIPIGAYAPSWFMEPIHVNPEQALRIHQDIGAKQSMGIHWGAFLLTAEPVSEPPQRLAQAVAKAGLPATAFSTFALGETRRYSAGTEPVSAEPQ